jgi:oligo-1,6-glucosidase
MDFVLILPINLHFPDVEVTLPDEVAPPATKYYSNMPRSQEFLLEIREIIDRYQNIMTVGALPNTPLPQNVLPYVSAKARQLDMAFNFDTVCLGQTPGKWLLPNSFTTADFKRLISRWQTFIAGTDGWTTIFLENYDQGRSISRFASDQTEELRARSRKLMAMILATMTGTLFIYQGQEVGMVNAPRSWGPEEYKYIRSVNFYARVQQTTHGDPQALGKTLDGMQKVGRDHARLPMQWDATANAGFCSTAKPWMRAHDNFREVNVAKQIDDENSVLEFWKSMLRLGKQHKDVLVYGEYELIDTAEQDLFIFAKRAGEQRVLTVANFIRRRLPRSQTMGSRLFYDWNW